MDEHDFDQILHTDFHPNTVPPAEHHTQVQVQPVQEVHEVAPHDAPIPDDKAEDYTLDHVQLEHDQSGIARFGSGSPSSPSHAREGSASDANLTVAEKKRKQRELNRLAASRSRKKKQGELGVLESHVDELTSENERLKARLSALQAERPGSSHLAEVTHHQSVHQPVASTSQTPLPTVDHHYFRKVILDLQHYRQVLIAKELELAGQRTGNPDTSNPNSVANVRLLQLRIDLTQKAAELSISRAEQKSVQTIIQNLRLEKDNLAEYRNRITREVDARMAIKQINGVADVEADAKQESDVERALRQVVACIDETIAKWDQNDPSGEGAINIDPQLRERSTVTA